MFINTNLCLIFVWLQKSGYTVYFRLVLLKDVPILHCCIFQTCAVEGRAHTPLLYTSDWCCWRTCPFSIVVYFRLVLLKDVPILHCCIFQTGAVEGRAHTPLLYTSDWCCWRTCPYSRTMGRWRSTWFHSAASRTSCLDTWRLLEHTVLFYTSWISLVVDCLYELPYPFNERVKIGLKTGY